MEFMKKVTQRLRQAQTLRRLLHKEDGLINTTDILVATGATVILAAGIAGATLSTLDAANYGKAQPDAQVIANAINEFYQDTGLWPGQKEQSADGSETLFLATGAWDGTTSTFTLPQVASDGLISADTNCTDNSGQGFVQGSVKGFASSTTSILLDSTLVLNLNDYLVRNPGTGYPGWAGPYVQEIANDPWDHAWVAYLTPLYCSEDVSAASSTGGTLGYAWLLTGGANGTITSRADDSNLDDDGDDAGVNLGKLTSTQVPGITP